MARYKLTLAYDGAAFFGSQRQSSRRTVQSELEKAARRIGWEGSSVILSGRTDAGVHATGQVAAIDISWAHNSDSFRDALNSALPLDLVVLRAEPAEDHFHPRFDALGRRYRYDVRCGPLRHPLDDRLAWRVWPPIRIADLNRAAARLLGTHDFGAFGSAARKGGGATRSVSVSEWRSAGALLSFEIVADGFLYRMVRRLVFVQVSVAQGRCTELTFRQALAEGRRVPGLPAGIAPAQGLRLVEVMYP